MTVGVYAIALGWRNSLSALAFHCANGSADPVQRYNCRSEIFLPSMHTTPFESITARCMRGSARQLDSPPVEDCMDNGHCTQYIRPNQLCGGEYYSKVPRWRGSSMLWDRAYLSCWICFLVRPHSSLSQRPSFFSLSLSLVQYTQNPTKKKPSRSFLISPQIRLSSN